MCLTEDKYVQILRTICFTDFFISTVFSCPFSSTAIAEDDQKNLKVDPRAAGMSSKNDLFLYDFFKNHEAFTRSSLYCYIFF